MISRMKNITLSVTILLVTFIVTGKDIFSQETAKVIAKRTINLCKNDNNRFTIGINIGEVQTTDSLFGFDIELKYDPTKIRFINALTGNTLSEIFEEKNFSYGYEENLVKGYATTMKFNIIPPSGSKDLIAFFAEWIGDMYCPDSSLIEINRLEFTDEFQKKVTEYVPAYVYTVNEPDKTDKLIFSFDKSNYIIPSGVSELKIYVDVTKPMSSKINTFKVLLNNSKVIKLREVKSLDNHSIINEYDENHFTFDFTYSNTNTNLELTYDYLLKDTISSYSYLINKIEYAECNCIYDYVASGILISKDSVFASVQEEYAINYNCSNNTFTISDDRIKEIKFVDILGRNLGSYNVTTPLIINLDNISTNVIFAIIKANNNYEIKKFYKCY